MTNPIYSRSAASERWVSIHRTPGTLDSDNTFYVYLPESNGANRDIALNRKDLVEGLKRAGITAEDFREPTREEIFNALPIGTVVKVHNPRIDTGAVGTAIKTVRGLIWTDYGNPATILFSGRGDFTVVYNPEEDNND